MWRENLKLNILKNHGKLRICKHRLLVEFSRFRRVFHCKSFPFVEWQGIYNTKKTPFNWVQSSRILKFSRAKFSEFSHRSCEIMSLHCVPWENGKSLYTNTMTRAFPPSEGSSVEEGEKAPKSRASREMRTRERASKKKKKDGKTRQQTQNFSFFFVLVSCSLLPINRKRRNYIIKLRKIFEEKRTNGGKLIISRRELIFFLFLFCALTKSAQSIEHRLSNERWCRRQWQLTAVYRATTKNGEKWH